MQLRNLGKTGLHVSELSLGGLFTSSLGGGVEETRKLLSAAWEMGINLIDTAPAYADSEETIGQALAGLDVPIIISTKLGGRPQPFDAQDANALRYSVEESLRILNRDVIEILFIHEPDRPQQYQWWSSYDPLDGPALEVISELKQEGKILYSGIAGTTVSEMSSLIRSNQFDVVLTAFNYNILYREALQEVFPSALERNMGIVLGSTMGQGGLARRFDEVLRQKPVWLSETRRQQFLSLYQFVDDCGLQLPELCLRFAIGNPHVSTIPIGCKSIEQLEQSVRAVERGPLPDDMVTRLDEIAAMVPYRPFEEPMILPFGKPYYGPAMANIGAGIPVGKLESVSIVE